jgi:alpha-tubulin suppressor-like RCC1 family protein
VYSINTNIIFVVFTFGDNRAGQLGLGPSAEDAALEPSVVEALRGKTVVDVQAGEQFSMALTDLGDVFTWGRGKEGQLGHGGKENGDTPRKVDALAHDVVVQIAAGWQHCIVRTASHRVYTWGSLHTLNEARDAVPTFGVAVNLPGLATRRILEQSTLAYFSGGDDEAEAAVRELNFGAFRSKLELLPVQVDFFNDKVVTCVAAGYAFSVAVTDDGACYTWGFNEVGQLGHGHRFNSHHPVRVAGLAHERVVAVACGQQHALALTATHVVYSWGLGVFGQLGHGTLHNSTRPRPIAGIRGDAVQCGAHFSVVLRHDLPPYVFGHAEYGQHAGTKNYQDWDAGGAEASRRGGDRPHAAPRVPDALQGVTVDAIACGSLHSLAIVRAIDSGSAAAAASAARAGDALDVKQDPQDPQQVLSWGWGSSGSLGHGDRRFQLVPKQVFSFAGIPFSRVAAGAKHSIAVASTTSFALDYLVALSDMTTSDVVFVVGKRRLYAHGSLLRARLPGLERVALFQSRFTNEHGAPLPRDDADAAKRCMRLGATQFQVLRALLIYAYSDQVQCPPHLFVPLARLAFQCGCARLSAMAWRRAELAGHAQARFPNADAQTTSGAAQREAAAAQLRSALSPSTLVRDLGTLVSASDDDDADASRAAYRAGDVGLRVGDTTVRAHRWVLVARSSYFKQLFEGGFSESRCADEVVLDGISPATLRTVLLHLYTGETESLLTSDNVVDVLAAADMLLLEPLKQRCERMLMEALEAEDAPWMFSVSEMFGAPKLRRVCKQMLLDRVHASDGGVDSLEDELAPRLLAEIRADAAAAATAAAS